MLEVLNIGRLGPRIELAGGVDPSDGELDLVLVEEAQRDILIGYLDAVAANRQPPPPFRSTRASSIRLRLPSQVCVHIDGGSEQIDAPVDLSIGIERHAVRFLGGTST